MVEEKDVGRINKLAAYKLAAVMYRKKLWATPEETEEWLKTETGQQIAALIKIEQQKYREKTAV